jgi:hypothetical protein
MEDTPINDANEEFDVVNYYMNSSRRLLVRPCHGIVLKQIPSQLLSSFFTLVKMKILVEIWS